MNGTSDAKIRLYELVIDLYGGLGRDMRMKPLFE